MRKLLSLSLLLSLVASSSCQLFPSLGPDGSKDPSEMTEADRLVLAPSGSTETG